MGTRVWGRGWWVELRWLITVLWYYLIFNSMFNFNSKNKGKPPHAMWVKVPRGHRAALLLLHPLFTLSFICSLVYKAAHIAVRLRLLLGINVPKEFTSLLSCLGTACSLCHCHLAPPSTLTKATVTCPEIMVKVLMNEWISDGTIQHMASWIGKSHAGKEHFLDLKYKISFLIECQQI